MTRRENITAAIIRSWAEEDRLYRLWLKTQPGKAVDELRNAQRLQREARLALTRARDLLSAD